MRRDERLLHVAALDSSNRTTHRLHTIDFLARIRNELSNLGIDDLRTLEDVAVLEQVRFVCEYLLNPQ